MKRTKVRKLRNVVSDVNNDRRVPFISDSLELFISCLLAASVKGIVGISLGVEVGKIRSIESVYSSVCVSSSG